MKVIAIISRDSYLIQADDYEIGRIMGEYCASGRQIVVGSEIPVSDLYEATRQIVSGASELSKKCDSAMKTMLALEKFGAELGPIAEKIKEKELKEGK